jgi:methionyl aminopeptidase
MSLIKSKNEVPFLVEGGARLARVLDILVRHARAGISTKELDEIAEHEIRATGDIPAFLNYTPRGGTIPFSGTVCTSVNDEVVHGIPSSRILEEGDIVGLDIGLSHEGLFVDMAVTIPIGAITPEEQKLLEATKKALFIGIEKARAGNTTGDIGAAIEAYARPLGYGIVDELGGHGVGHEVHEEPYVPNVRMRGFNEKLVSGMVIAIEPMLTLGTGNVIFLDDGFTVKTKDGSKSAHFEHTVLITEGEPRILTMPK